MRLAKFNQARALSEGWCIMNSDNRGAEIQRDDQSEVLFATDADAVAYVKEQASNGSFYHAVALNVVLTEFLADTAQAYWLYDDGEEISLPVDFVDRIAALEESLL